MMWVDNTPSYEASSSRMTHLTVLHNITLILTKHTSLRYNVSYHHDRIGLRFRPTADAGLLIFK